MASLSEHPTVKRFQEQVNTSTAERLPQKLDAEWLRQLCFNAGADDVGFVEIDRPELAELRAEITAAFSHTKTLVSFVCRMNLQSVRSPARSVGTLNFITQAMRSMKLDVKLWQRLNDEVFQR